MGSLDARRADLLIALARIWGLRRVMSHQPYRRLLGPAGRIRAWQELGANIDDNVTLGPWVWIRNPEKVRIGSGSRLSGRIFIDAWNQVTIGSNVLIGDHVDLLTGGHDVDDPRFKGKGGPITIGDHAWLPRRVIVLPGVSIGDRAVVGTGSVVTRSVPDNGIAVGNPARVVRTRAQVDYEYVPSRFVFKRPRRRPAAR